MSQKQTGIATKHTTTNHVSAQPTKCSSQSLTFEQHSQINQFSQTSQSIDNETSIYTVNNTSTLHQSKPVFPKAEPTEKRDIIDVELNVLDKNKPLRPAAQPEKPSTKPLATRLSISQPLQNISAEKQLKELTDRPSQLPVKTSFAPLEGGASQTSGFLSQDQDLTEKQLDPRNGSSQLASTNLLQTSNSDAFQQPSSNLSLQTQILTHLPKSSVQSFPEAQSGKSEGENFGASSLLPSVLEEKSNKLKHQSKRTQSNRITNSFLPQPNKYIPQTYNRVTRTSVPIAPAPIFNCTTGSLIVAHSSLPVMSNPLTQSNPLVSSPAVVSNAVPATTVSVASPNVAPHAASTSSLPGNTSDAASVRPIENKAVPRHCTVNLKPVAIELINLITEYLRSLPTHISGAGSSELSSFCKRMKDDDDPYHGNLDEMAWAVRGLIRMEFHKISYPTPPSPGLLLLVSKTETLLTNSSNQTRPSYFPGTRITAPTNDGTRRVGTTLQLRTKIVQSKPTVDAMLHLDGPDGGAFMWLQVTSLAPLGGISASPLNVQLKGTGGTDGYDTTRGRGRRGRGSRGTARGSRSGRRVPRGQRNSNERASLSVKQGVQKSPSTATTPVVQRNNQGTPPASVATGSLSNPTGSRNGVSSLRNTGTGRGTAVARVATTNRTANNSRGPTVEQAPGVPTSLVCATPPPRSRIIGNSRPVSFTNGSLRRALDVSKCDVASTAVKLQLILGIERLVARRLVDKIGIQYFVKWSGRSIREGSWESRESLLEDVPGLVRDFDIRHPDESLATYSDRKSSPSGKEDEGTTTVPVTGEQATEMSTEKHSVESNKVGERVGKKRENEVDFNEKNIKEQKQSESGVKEYVDDVSGVKIPSWVDSPILELNVCGMVLQIRRPDDYSLHADVETAARDTKRRQAEFKKKNIEAAVRVFALSRTEAKFAIDHGLRAHKELNQHAIKFPRGLGRVSASDHGIPFAAHDVFMAPLSWDAYLLHLGMSPSDYLRDLPPYMPTTDSNCMAKLVNTGHEMALSIAQEHRERARSLVREAYRCDGSVTPPVKLFRDGARLPPGVIPPPRKRTRTSNSATDIKKALVDTKPSDVEFERCTLLRERDKKVNDIIRESETQKGIERKDGMWFDSVWACWRKASSSDS